MQVSHKICSQLFRSTRQGRFKVRFHNRPIKLNFSEDIHYKNVRYLHNVPKNSSSVEKTPELVYIPKLFRWLSSKIKLKYLQRVWDCEFSEGAFIYGSTKAICRITEIIHRDNIQELDGLLSKSAKNKLIIDLHTKVTPAQKSMIELKPSDIKILIPVSVKLSQTATQKLCKINLRILALKWFKPIDGIFTLVLVALQAEFTRDYKCPDSDWTITNFDVLDCMMLKETPRF